MSIEGIRRAVTISDALELLGSDLPDRMPGHVFCFQHDEHTPSLAVWEDHWHAFCCGKGGDVIDLVAFATNSNISQAVRFLQPLADDEDYDPENRPEVTRHERVLADLTKKFEAESEASDMNGVENLLMRYHQDGRWPAFGTRRLWDWGIRANRYNLLVPHRDDEGVVRGVKTRSLMGDLGKKGAFPDSCFTTRLYRVNENPHAPGAILVEGESDCWSMQMAYDSARGGEMVAVYGLPSGAMCWKPQFVQELSQHRSVWMFLDSDETGRKAADRIKADLPHADNLTVPEQFKDVAMAVAAGWRPWHG